MKLATRAHPSTSALASMVAVDTHRRKDMLAALAGEIRGESPASRWMKITEHAKADRLSRLEDMSFCETLSVRTKGLAHGCTRHSGGRASCMVVGNKASSSSPFVLPCARLPFVLGGWLEPLSDAVRSVPAHLRHRVCASDPIAHETHSIRCRSLQASSTVEPSKSARMKAPCGVGA